MKKMILMTVLLAAICTVTFGKKVVAKGQTFSALGNYKIETVDNPVSMKGDECQAFTISYENTPMEVTIIVCKDRKCRKYVVLSDKLSVQYVCNKVYFGVERLDKAFENDGHKTTDENLNRVEYFHQKVLGPGQQPVIEATKLIAAYFPFLLNTNTSMTATR
ncbi:MAG: hypothetical protein NT092_06970 [Bacteroidia bacterium]|nr:hypothetical protein [Bacteroidia bacterium]